jgi:pyridoxine/pyridoxamine 5'-phosphate oxidase
VERVSREEAEAYFRKRPRGNQLGAAASAQSRPVPSRRFLEERFAELDKLYGSDESLPLPEEWGGWRLTPDRFEFWQGQASRLHDRLVYTPGGAGRIGGDGWRIERLAP